MGYWDTTWLLTIQQIGGADWIKSFSIGLSSQWAFTIPVTLLIGWGLYQRHHAEGLRCWLILILVMGGGDQLGNQLKRWFHQPRPCQIMPIESQQMGQLSRPVELCGTKLAGMPSNHALLSAAVFAFLTQITGSHLWSAILAGCALLIGISRIYLNKHYPSQVLAGWLLGFLWGGMIGAQARAVLQKSGRALMDS